MENSRQFKVSGDPSRLNREARRTIKKAAKSTFLPGALSYVEYLSDVSSGATPVDLGGLTMMVPKTGKRVVEIPEEFLGGFESDAERYGGAIDAVAGAIAASDEVAPQDVYAVIGGYLKHNFAGFSKMAEETVGFWESLVTNYEAFYATAPDLVEVLFRIAVLDREPVARHLCLAMLREAFPSEYRRGIEVSDTDALARSLTLESGNFKVSQDTVVPMLTAVVHGARDQGEYSTAMFRAFNVAVAEHYESRASASVFQGEFFRSASCNPEESCRGNEEARAALAKEIATEIVGHPLRSDTEVSYSASPREWRAFATEFKDWIPSMRNEEDFYTEIASILLETLPADSVRKMTKRELASAYVAAYGGFTAQESLRKAASVLKALVLPSEASPLVASIMEASLREGLAEEALARESRNEMQGEISALKEEVAQLREELAAAKRKAERYREKIAALRAPEAGERQEEPQEETVAEEHPPTEEPGAPAPVKELSYSEALEVLNGLDVLLVTGDVPQLAKFREAFPEWEIVTDGGLSTANAAALVKARDAVVFDVINIPHSLSYKFKGAARKLGVPMADLARNRNMEIIVPAVLRDLLAIAERNGGDAEEWVAMQGRTRNFKDK